MRRRVRQLIVATAAGLALVVAGCQEGGGGSKDAGPTTDPLDFDRDVGGDSGAEWSIDVVQSGGVGRNVDLAVSSDGTVAAAYYANQGVDDGPCEGFTGENAPVGRRWPMHFAIREGGEWSVETVEKPLFEPKPPGLDLEWSPSGKPVIAAMGGEPLEMYTYCGTNSVALRERGSSGSWATEILVESSDEARVESGPAPEASNAGAVVGYWSTLAYGDDGRAAVAYRDVHTGGVQFDDANRADLEIAIDDGGGWRAEPVDPGRGAGLWSEIVFDSEGRPVVAYVNPVESQTERQVGVWVARSSDGGGEWTLTHLSSRPTPTGPAVAADDEGGVHVLYYNADRGFPTLASLTDPSAFGDAGDGWETQNIGNRTYDEGYDPSLTVDSEGELLATFYRCTVTEGELGECRTEEDAAVFASSRNGWDDEVVDAGTEAGRCGEHPSLALGGSGRPMIAYRCMQSGDDGARGAVKFAVREEGE